DRVRAVALLHAQPPPGAEQGADPGPCLELRLRRAGQHRRAVRLLPAQEDRLRPCPHDPHAAWGWLPAQTRPVSLTRLRPSQWTLRRRILLAVLALLAVVLTLTVVLSTASVERVLTDRLDRQLAAAAERAQR